MKPKCIYCGSNLEPIFIRGSRTPTLICPHTEINGGQIKCQRCNDSHSFLTAYTKEGAKLQICNNIKGFIVKYRTNKVKHVEIHCHRQLETSLITTFTQLTKQTVNYETLHKAVNHTLSPSILLENYNLAIMLDLPKSKIPQLFKSAYKLGMALGITPERAITSLVRGIGRKSIKWLDNLGIVFTSKQAYEKYPQLDKEKAWKTYAVEKVIEKAKRL